MNEHRLWPAARVLFAVTVVGVVSVMLALGLRGRTAHVAAQTAGGGDLGTELAERLLGTSPPIIPPPSGVPYPPYYQQSSSPVQLLPGALPADLPLKLPMPPNSTLIGSAERPSFPRQSPVLGLGPVGYPIPPTATPSPAPSGKHVDIVVDASGTMGEITSFYADAMTRLGWSPPPQNPYGPPSGGFLSSASPSSATTFCQSADGPWLAVTVLPATPGPQDVRIALDTGNAGNCGSPYGGGIAPPTPFPAPPGLGLLPRLQAPSGVSVQTTFGGGGGNGRWSSDADATTDMSPSDLDALYEQELVDAGWTRVDRGSAEALAWSTWSIPDQGDWQGFLYVRSGPVDGRRALHVEVASTNPQTVPGSYYGYGSVYTSPAVAVASASAGVGVTPTATPAGSATPTPTPSGR